jgi:hypothetical protein
MLSQIYAPTDHPKHQTSESWNEHFFHQRWLIRIRNSRRLIQQWNWHSEECRSIAMNSSQSTSLQSESAAIHSQR